MGDFINQMVETASNLWLVLLGLGLLVYYFTQLPKRRAAAMSVPIVEVHRLLALLRDSDGVIYFAEGSPPMGDAIAHRAQIEGWIIWRFDGGGGGSTTEYLELTEEGRSLMRMEPKKTVAERIKEVVRF